jgi:hypothetical protein
MGEILCLAEGLATWSVDLEPSIAWTALESVPLLATIGVSTAESLVWYAWLGLGLGPRTTVAWLLTRRTAATASPASASAQIAPMMAVRS